MKDFIKWLGVNEKIAKLVVWVFIIMGMLIIFNAALDSLGFPHYQITYDNLKKIKISSFTDIALNWVCIILNFFSMILLIFRIKNIKKIAKYSVLYLVLNILTLNLFNYAIAQVFIITFIIIFSYLFSERNKKYIMYAILSVIINMGVQGIAYYYKARLIDFASASELTKIVLSLDYFIIMGIIILVKEIYLKKRSEKNERN